MHEKKGVPQPDTTNKAAAAGIQKSRSKQPSVSDFVKYILAGDISYLSRAITLVESTNSAHQEKAAEILDACLPHANKSVRIGITGVPGAGKSTFIEAFGTHATALGKKVAVLAVDPSSSVHKGSILGDKTRMESLVTNANAFIRPSPSGNSLGGVAQKTRESIVLCEAAGFDTILIETVGVGQSETAVHNMVDFFLLLKIAGAGDELQGIKRGIIEMADIIVINKADGENLAQAKIAKTAFTNALHLYPLKQNKWQPKVLIASALYIKGIAEIQQLFEQFITHTKDNGSFQEKRNTQNSHWLHSTIEQQLKNDFYKNTAIKEALQTTLNSLENSTTTPFNAAKKLIALAKRH